MVLCMDVACMSRVGGIDSDMSDYIWMNGKICHLREARISPLDHGFLVGDGVFETLVARMGRPFAANAHWQRLVNSCTITGLSPMPKADFLAAMDAVLQANELTEARIRVTLTSGDGPLGSERGNSAQMFTVSASPLRGWPDTEKVCLVPWTRNETGALTGVKSTSYGENVRALAHAKAQGCGEALLANTRGELCEGTGSNLFIVVGGRLLTPPLTSGCLAGVTRHLVLRACSQNGIPCHETAIPISQLISCEEAFLTSSTRDVHPISQVDSRDLAAPGSITTRVSTAFRELASEFVLA